MLRKFFTAPLLRNILFVLLLLGVASALGYLATRYAIQRDITHNASNSLEPTSVEVLEQLTGPVNVTVYATEHDARLGDIRKAIRNFLSLYQRYKPDINLVFVDPEKEAGKARAAGIQLNGEMVVEHAGRSEHLTQLNEQIFTSTLLRLAHSRDQTVMYLDGHGERKLDGVANHDLGEQFGAKLKQNGFRLNSLNLVLAQEVPANISVLVITHPQLDLMPGEVDKLLRYVDRGGNLLWLVDAEPLRGLGALAEKLDLLLPPGIVIDPTAAEMNVPTTWSLGASYSPHAVTRNFNLITAFPEARSITWNENPEWEHHMLVEVAARGWVSRYPAKEKPRFDKLHDTPGPAVIAVAMQRNINDREQRIVVVGNGAFLSNSFAGNGGNVDLGVNMVNWLASEEHLITVQPRAARDSNLALSQTQLTIISVGFLIALPLLLAGVGGYIWWERRRA
ncbi:MAG: Gldg family protein [Gallionellaceae bacterium]|nr:Gldg family protein [Gallionellaceae bacterium]MDP1997304.1 Gldg family protein [Gallionella sp.]